MEGAGGEGVPFGSLVQSRQPRSVGWLPEGNGVISVSKWWGLRDCQSLAESWSTWILGCSPKREGTVAFQGVVPNIPKHPLPDSGLWFPGRGHRNFRQCNLSKIKHGEKR